MLLLELLRLRLSERLRLRRLPSWTCGVSSLDRSCMSLRSAV